MNLSRYYLWVTVALSLMVSTTLMGCNSDSPSDADADTDTGSSSGYGDSDTYTESDADTDADTDTDTDTDADTDADTDTQTETVVDTSTVSDSATNIDTGANTDPPLMVNGVLKVNFDFQSTLRARGLYLWVEDANGNYVDTIEQYFGRDGTEAYGTLGVRYPNDNPTTWKSAVGETDTLVVDGITGATPNGVNAAPGPYTSETWDCLDNMGNPIAQGEYVIQLEVTVDHESGHPNRDVFLYTAPISLADASQSESFTFVELSVDIDGNGEVAEISNSDVVASAAAEFTPVAR